MSDCVADPWQVKNNDSIEKQQQKNGNIPAIEKFKDNFNPNKIETRKTQEEIRDQKSESNVTSSQQQQQQGQQQLEPLPDSANYLQLLGKIYHS